MDNKIDIILFELEQKIDRSSINPTFINIYKNCNDKVKYIFAYYHQELNSLLSFMNERAMGNGHFLANDSRILIGIIDDIETMIIEFRDTELDFEFDKTYYEHLKYCEKFLQSTQGSEIPSDYTRIYIKKYEPIFKIYNNVMNVADYNYKLSMIGSGSYANVYKYKDKYYNCYYGVKQLKKSTDVKEKERFKHEYEVLNKYNHPNILKVYRYLENNSSYIMEYCDFTLSKYYSSKGNQIPFNTRKSIALQFLRALKIIHKDGLLHRDISFNNILLKVYDNELIIVKISDFGLVKDKSLELTSTYSDIKGTVVDDTLKSFKDYNIKNEIYVIGVILYYIFTGKKSLIFNNSQISKISQKCVDRNHINRYNSVDEIITDVSKILENEGKTTEKNMLTSKIKIDSNIMHKDGLNELSVEILKKAVDKNGIILYLKTLEGIRIQIEEDSYVPNNAREEAELENVIDLLESYGYIKSSDYKRDLFKVTKKGYDYFEEQVVYV